MDRSIGTDGTWTVPLELMDVSLIHQQSGQKNYKMKTEAFVLIKKGKPEKAFERRPWEIPSALPHQIVIESEAFGLNYAEVLASKGLYKEAPSKPSVLGYEVVGKVIEVGENVEKSWLGKRVLAFCRFGGYAKHVISENFAFVDIENIPTVEALALCTQGVTAYYMSQYLSPVRKKERVLIHAAAGGVGTLLIQLCKQNGAEVFAKVGSESKIGIVKKLGADHAIIYNHSDYYVQMRNLLGDKRLDVSFNPVAGSTFPRDMKLLGSGGRLVLFGGSELGRGKWGIFSLFFFLFSMGFPIPIGFMMRSKNLLGVNMLKIADNKPEVLFRCLENVILMYKDGNLKPEVGGEYRANEFLDAFKNLESGASTGKIGVFW